MSIAPLPRLRIYTSASQYLSVLLDIVTGRAWAGDAMSRLERMIADRVGTAHAIAMPMARVGIYFAIKALIKPGQKVILSPYTIADVVNMVVCAGGIPLFADIERETCNIDASEVERLIDNSVGAVMVTHFYGLACDVKRIVAVCKGRRVPLIEDAAQAFGVIVDGQAVGTFGRVGILSFGMYKNVNSFLGGMIVTSDAATETRIRQEMNKLPYQPLGGYMGKVLQAFFTDAVTFPPLFRAGFFWLFRYAFIHDIHLINKRLRIDADPKLKTQIPAGYLCRMTPLQARLIIGQLDNVECDTKKRIEKAELYHNGLSDIPELILPPMRTDMSHMYWYFPIQYEKRHDLVAYAMKTFRDITESYHRNCADLPCFAPWYRDCPRARATANSLIYLPTYPRYSKREIEKTIKVIRQFFGK